VFPVLLGAILRAYLPHLDCVVWEGEALELLMSLREDRTFMSSGLERICDSQPVIDLIAFLLSDNNACLMQ
jgi:hypothetical protein